MGTVLTDVFSADPRASASVDGFWGRFTVDAAAGAEWAAITDARGDAEGAPDPTGWVEDADDGTSDGAAEGSSEAGALVGAPEAGPFDGWTSRVA